MRPLIIVVYDADGDQDDRGALQRDQSGPVDCTGPSRKTDDGQALPHLWCMGFLTGMRLRMDAWQPLLDLNGVDHGLLLPILLYCVDPSDQPMLGPPREGPETGEFLRTAYQDIPLVVPTIREFYMPERVRGANGQP